MRALVALSWLIVVFELLIQSTLQPILDRYEVQDAEPQEDGQPGA